MIVYMTTLAKYAMWP